MKTMKKLWNLFVFGLFVVAISLAGSAYAQKKHAPKAVWKAMVAGLNDIQNITAALTVFDMDRAAKIGEELVKRETFISNLQALPPKARELHAKVAEAAKGVVAAAKAGEENQLADALGSVLKACNECHYNLRDAERRKKQ